MATTEQLESALRKADAAGNAEDARALAAELRRLRGQTPSEIPKRLPPISLAGDRATGFRQQVEATGMTPEERQSAVRGLIPVAAGFAAGPVVAAGIRAASAAPAAATLARAVESGGLAKDLSVPMRVAGGGIAGGATTAVTEPEDVATGAAIGAITPGVARVARAVAMPKSVTSKQLKEQSQAAYQAAESIQADVSPSQFANLTYKLEQTLGSSGFNPILHPKANVAVNAFVEQAKSGQPVTLNQLDTLRRVASRAAGSKSPDEQRIGSALVKDVDQFIGQNIETAAVQQIEKARDLWARMSRGRMIESIIKTAKRSSEEPATAIRKRFQRLADDERQLNRFSEAEQDLIKSIGKGKIDVRMLESVGTLAPPRLRELRTLPGMFTTAGYGGLAQYLGPTKAGVIGGLGFGSRALANRLAMMRAERLGATVRSGGPYEPRFAPEYAPQLAPVFGVNMLGEPSE